MKILVLGSGMMGPAAAYCAMARTTAFTASIVAQLIARGELRASGLLHPEQVISGPRFDRPVIELAKYDIRFNFSEALTE